MKKIEELKNYIYPIVLILVIFILLSIVSYDKLNNTNKQLSIKNKDKLVEITSEIKKNNNNIYINFEEYNKVLDNNVYLDKISRKLIYTTNSGLKKEPITSNNNVIYENASVWIDFRDIQEKFSTNTYYIPQIKTVFIDDSTSVTGNILKNNVELYYLKEKNKTYNFRLNKNSKVEVLNNSENKVNNKYIQIIYTNNNNEYIGYVLKENIKFTLENNTNNEILKETKKINLGISQDGVYSNIQNIDIVAVDILKLTNPNGNIREENRDKVIKQAKKDKKELYAILDNDYDAANFSNYITSSMLNSEINRENNINKVLKFIKENKFSGVIIDFKKFKTSDKLVYTQYIREMCSVITSNGFKVLVKSGLETYIDTEAIINICDSTILELYNQKKINSNISGTHFDYNNIIKIVEKYKEKNILHKIILELPLYSILWTERNGLVVQAEKYSAKLEKEYIEKNNIKLITNEILKQKYFEINKGKITYKMWLEDEYSLNNKLDIVEKYGLRGISLYKFGYETKEIKEVLLNEL